MAVLTAAVVALSIAVAANFFVLLAVVRRLRMQRPAAQAIDVPMVGMRIPSFSVEDVDGHAIDEGFCSEHAEAVIGFFAEDCAPCERVRTQLEHDPLQDPLLAFVQPSPGSSYGAEFAVAFAGTGARTVLLDPNSDLRKRFSVSAFPTLMRVRNGVVVASSVKLADIRAL
jgi:thiol-disulfide isomerase/thioredoxin